MPGITFGAGEGGNPQGDRPFIRGFDAQGDTYLDGVRDTGAQSREIFAVESIEVSKGPELGHWRPWRCRRQHQPGEQDAHKATRWTAALPGAPTRPSATPSMATTSSATPLPAV
ncbi:TonB-dependent receptor plug domain-containing protein [Pseudomonas peli]|uniref:TonB-dependent receptor plug domain-containing protein n=1 Tax=Pseudomonas peli TaxID=592361 RepID=UPI0024AE4087|nr:TonB-dependent receptor plug domain-containing protein [Pseudomonas peli]